MRLDPDATRLSTVELAGRPATMLVAPRHDGWGAVVVAGGPDLLFMHLYVPTAEELDAAWDTWLLMVDRLRLTRGGAQEPLIDTASNEESVFDDLEMPPRLRLPGGAGVR
jgi:hypothetical protein